MTYPTQCTSAFCGKILCDGCTSRPVLVKFYARRGADELAKYEAGQARLRQEKAEGRGIWAQIGGAS